MRKFIYLLAGLILTGFTANAAPTNLEANVTANFYRGYGNSFIFVENGIEFSVFPDGQFDFNIPRYCSNVNVSVGSPNFNISFNSGFDYNAYVQYDEFGAIIQIENTPIFYDYYGRIVQAGNVTIHYNNFGRISRVGGLYVHYNRYNRFSHYTGFINIYNKRYVYRPWHRFYSVPAVDYCVVYNRPYRRHYTPVRYVYNRPFYNNYRPRTAIASRRGNTIARNRSYATANRNSRNRTKVNHYSKSRRTVSQHRNLKKKDYGRNIKSNNRVTANRNAKRPVSRVNDRNNNIRHKNIVRNRSSQPKTRIKSKAQITTTTHVDPAVRQAPKRTVTRQVTRNRSTTVLKKPKVNNSRIYSKRSAKRNSGQTVNRVSRTAPKATHRVANRSRQTNTRATQNRSASRNNNTNSSLRRRI